MDDVLLSGAIQIADELYRMELWRQDSDPPFRTAANRSRFEGGVVVSVDGQAVTLSDVRQAIDPSDGGIDFGTVLGASHAGRVALVWTSAGDGQAYDIVSNGNEELTLAGDLGDLGAGDVLVICDRLVPTAANADRGIDELSAGFSMAFDFGELMSSDVDPGPIEQIDSMSWVFWRQRCWSDTGDSGWMPVGLFCLNRDPDEAQPGRRSMSLSGMDALKWAMSEPVVRRWSSDKIPAYDIASAGQCLHPANLPHGDPHAHRRHQLPVRCPPHPGAHRDHAARRGGTGRRAGRR